MQTKTAFFSSYTPVLSSNPKDIMPFSHSLFLSDSIPRLENYTPPVKDLLHIPPLTVQDSSQKRINLCDLGNPVSKKVKYNPEVSLSQTSFSPIQRSEKSYFEKPIISQKCIKEFLSRKDQPGKKPPPQFVSVPSLKKTDDVIQRPLNCFEIPQNRKLNRRIQVQAVNDAYQTSEQLQKALQVLSQKFETSNKNDQKDSLDDLSDCQILTANSDAVSSGFEQTDFELKAEGCSNGSPLSTTEDSTHSCSTSELCENEQRLDLDLSNLQQSQLLTQIDFLDFCTFVQDFSTCNNDSNALSDNRNETIKTEVEIEAENNLKTEEVSKTPVGVKHQAEIPALNKGLGKAKRCPRLQWDPSIVAEDVLTGYYEQVEKILKCPINPEKAIQLLIECQNDPKRVYKCLEGKEKRLFREFIIKIQRRS